MLQCLIVKFNDSSCWISWINGLIESISILLQKEVCNQQDYSVESHTACFLWIDEEKERKWNHPHAQVC